MRPLKYCWNCGRKVLLKEVPKADFNVKYCEKCKLYWPIEGWRDEDNEDGKLSMYDILLGIFAIVSMLSLITLALIGANDVLRGFFP